MGKADCWASCAGIIAVSCALVCGALAAEQTYPVKAMRIVVPIAPGGGRSTWWRG